MNKIISPVVKLLTYDVQTEYQSDYVHVHACVNEALAIRFDLGSNTDNCAHVKGGKGSYTISATCVGIAIPLPLLQHQICSLPSATQTAPHSHPLQCSVGESTQTVGEWDMYLSHTPLHKELRHTLHTHITIEESVSIQLHTADIDIYGMHSANLHCEQQ